MSRGGFLNRIVSLNVQSCGVFMFRESMLKRKSDIYDQKRTQNLSTINKNKSFNSNLISDNVLLLLE